MGGMAAIERTANGVSVHERRRVSAGASVECRGTEAPSGAFVFATWRPSFPELGPSVRPTRCHPEPKARDLLSHFGDDPVHVISADDGIPPLIFCLGQGERACCQIWQETLMVRRCSIMTRVVANQKRTRVGAHFLLDVWPSFSRFLAQAWKP